MLCQFSPADDPSVPTLAEFVDLPGIYPAGRLDKDSEGLLILTDDGRQQDRIAHPRHGSLKRYLAQVEGVPGAAQLRRLQSGITLKDGPARAQNVELLAGKPGWLWRRDPPVRQRKSVPHAWLELSLDEGRNRQVRRMTAAVGLPTLRLVRMQVGEWELGDLAPGQYRQAG